MLSTLFSILIRFLIFPFKVSKNFKKATSYNQSYGGFRSQFSHSTDDEFGEDDVFSDHHRVPPRTKADIFLNSGPPTSHVAEAGTYFYPHPSAPQYMMPFNHSMMYQSIPYQTPYNNSYSPVSTASDLHENQMVYYAGPQAYSYPQMSMRTLPHTGADASIIPSALQSHTHALYRNGE
jgi:hypothetical protein